MSYINPLVVSGFENTSRGSYVDLRDLYERLLWFQKRSHKMSICWFPLGNKEILSGLYVVSNSPSFVHGFLSWFF